MIISLISTISLSNLKKFTKMKKNIVRAIPLPPISIKKGPVPIFPPNKKVKNFFDKIGFTIEIKSEKTNKESKYTLLFENGDLLLMKNGCQSTYQHRVCKSKTEKERISLVFKKSK